jgi:hypothetical protein
MATADEYAAWIVKNADKKGTPEFETVAQAYAQAKSSEAKPAKERTLGEKLAGVGEAALTAVTGMTAPVGMAVGTVAGLGEAIANGTYGTQQGAANVEKRAQQAASAYVYQPRGAAGQEYVQALGEAAQPLQALGPMGAEMAMGANVARQAIATPTQAVKQAVMPAVTQAVKAPVAAVRRAIGSEAQAPTAGTMGSVGAAATDRALQRAATAEALPVPIQMTQGQATRDFGMKQFESETMKNAEAGKPLRQKYVDQNQQVYQNFDAMIEATGAEAPSLRAVGIAVDEGIRKEAARAKAEVRVLYRQAEKAGELAQPVPVTPIAQLLAAPETQAAEGLSAIIPAAKNYLSKLQEIEGSPDTLSINNLENLRKFVRQNGGNEPTDLFWKGELTKAIDAATEAAGGTTYSKARAARRQYAQDFERIGLVDKLLTAKKNSDDRRIALEDVVNRVVVGSDTDSLAHINKLLTRRNVPGGTQAWKEIQGATIGKIRDDVFKSVARDEAGNLIPSPAAFKKSIDALDAEGKLDLILGKQRAAQLRDLSEVVQDIYTAPPGAINTSNTASILRMLMESGVMGATIGAPVPLVSGAKYIRDTIADRKLARRVEQAINWKPKQ